MATTRLDAHDALYMISNRSVTRSKIHK